MYHFLYEQNLVSCNIQYLTISNIENDDSAPAIDGAVQSQISIFSLIISFAALVVAVYSNLSILKKKVLSIYAKSHKNSDGTYTTYMAVCNITPNSVIDGKGKNVNYPLTCFVANKSDSEICEIHVITDLIKNHYIDATEKGFAFPVADINQNKKCVTVKFCKLSYGDWFILKMKHMGKLKSNFCFECDIFGVDIELEYKKTDSLVNKTNVITTIISILLILITIYLAYIEGNISLLIFSITFVSLYFFVLAYINRLRVPFSLRKKVWKLSKHK